ncbi:tetratricopeptide repeat protein [Microbispora rosea]|uniref:tetratricopeptide repeat protein n=1 Tax=Microbispora rosea TaxID=58117 RepID=UPI0036AF501B
MIGLVVEDTKNYHHARLTALPIERLVQDDAFRSTLERFYGSIPRLEPAEIAPILTSARQASLLSRDRISYASLLKAEARAVKFRGRSGFLADFVAWCTAGGVGIRLLTGPGGQGKSRFAGELIDRLSDQGWMSGWILADADLDSASKYIRRIETSTILVLDYAETRPEKVDKLIRLIAERKHSNSALKLLLISRSAGDWWEQIVANRAGIGTIPAIEVAQLPPLEETIEGRQAAYIDACRDLGRRLGVHVPNDLQIPNLRDSRYGSPLMLQMEALAHLLEPALASSGGSPEEIIVAHEEPYWMAVARASGVNVHRRVLRRAVVAATLCSAINEDEAFYFLSRIPGFRDQSEDIKLKGAIWLHDLYALDMDGFFWGPLQPDRLGEYLIARALREEPDLLAYLVSSENKAAAYRSITVLARAASHQTDLGPLLTSLIVSDPDLATVAVDVAPRSENPYPLLAAFDALLESVRDDPDNLVKIAAFADSFPISSSLLNPLALKTAQLLVAIFTVAAGESPEEYGHYLVRALDALSLRLSHSGMHKEALTAAERAVDVHERLAFSDPESYAVDYAASLYALGNRLAQNGRLDDALRVSQRALEMRGIAAQSGMVEMAALANSLGSVAMLLHQNGRTSEALDPIERAVDLYAMLYNKEGEKYSQRFAASLVNASTIYAFTDRYEDALRQGRRAVEIFRSLYADNPDTCTSEYAAALTNLSAYLMRNGQTTEAATVTQEGVQIHRRLVESNPKAHSYPLATALNIASRVYSAVGRSQDARAALEESIALLRGLVKSNRSAYANDLALALTNYANELVEEAPEKAILLAEEAVSLRRELTQNQAHPNTTELAKSMIALSQALNVGGKHREALVAALESVHLLADLAKDDLRLQRGSFPEALAVYARCAVDAGDPVTAVEPAHVAMTLAHRHKRDDLARYCGITLIEARERAPEAVKAEWLRVTGVPWSD